MAKKEKTSNAVSTKKVKTVKEAEIKVVPVAETPVAAPAQEEKPQLGRPLKHKVKQEHRNEC